MSSQDHHFIPQSHLRRFAPGGKIVVYDKRYKLSPRFKAPKGQAFQTNLYTFAAEGGRLESKIEDEILQQIDSNGAVELQHLHETAGPNSMENLALYVASLVIRTPKAIEKNRLLGSVMLQQMFPRMLRDPEILQNLRKASKDEKDFRGLMRAAKTAKVGMHRDFSMTTQISLHPRIAIELLECEWQLLIAGGVEEFIIADTPAFSCDPWSRERSVAAIARPKNETTVPLSSQMCLLIAKTRTPSFMRRFVSDESVREINRRSAYSADHKFFASRVQESWGDLAREFPPSETKIDYKQTKMATAFLQLVDNHLFRPLA